MIELIRRLDRDRWSVHVACLNARGRWLARVNAAAQSLEEFPVRSFRSSSALRSGRSFVRWLGARGIALLHTSDVYANIFGLPAAALARVPVRVGNRRGVNQDRSAAHLVLQRAAYACAHVVVANSAALARRLRREGVPARKIAIVPNGLDVAAFTPAPARSLRRRVIMVANLRPEKGHDLLITAAARVVRQFPDAHFTLVGDGPARGALGAQIAAHELEHAFALLGERDDVPALLAQADIAVLPSRTESMPNAVLEAMAAGLPVIATHVGGIPDIIDHMRTGLLIPPENPAALADQIAALMADAALAARLGAAARAEVRARFSFERMVASIDALYVRELARRGVIHAQDSRNAPCVGSPAS